MPRIGLVLNTTDKYATVSTSRGGVCAECSEKSSCSSQDTEEKGIPELVNAINPIQAKPGDYVEFDLSGHTELKVSLIVWVVPLIGLILGAFAGSFFFDNLSRDSGTLLGAFLGFIFAFSIIMVYDRYFVDKEKLIPLISKKIQKFDCVELPQGKVLPTTH
ncbi:SoxR reducing system RseC family protein [bacterium]|nr:SoxR reducing system RseC family protein [bacterium]